MHPANAYVVDASQLNGYGGLESSWGVWGDAYPAYTVAVDSAGNSYHVYNNGQIILAISASGKGQGQVWKAGTTSYDSVLAALKRVSAEQKISIELMIGGGAVTAGGGTTQGTDGVMSWLSNLFGKAATKEEKKAAWKQMEGAAATYGPGLINGVRSLINNKGSSLASLQKQLAKKKAQYQTTTNAKKKLQYQYEIQALEMQINQYYQMAQSAQSQVGPPPGTDKNGKTPFPWWIPVAILGGLGVVVFVATRKRS